MSSVAQVWENNPGDVIVISPGLSQHRLWDYEFITDSLMGYQVIVCVKFEKCGRLPGEEPKTLSSCIMGYVRSSVWKLCPYTVLKLSIFHPLYNSLILKINNELLAYPFKTLTFSFITNYSEVKTFSDCCWIIHWFKCKSEEEFVYGTGSWHCIRFYCKEIPFLTSLARSLSQ